MPPALCQKNGAAVAGHTYRGPVHEPPSLPVFVSRMTNYERDAVRVAERKTRGQKPMVGIRSRRLSMENLL